LEVRRLNPGVFSRNSQSKEVFAMDQVVHQMPPQGVAKNSVEVVVHISGQLDYKQRNNLVVALEGNDGIISAEFCHLRDHLMLVRYDRDHYSSHDVLAAFDTQKVNARLIGPI
jgi:hypothetical protein